VGAKVGGRLAFASCCPATTDAAHHARTHATARAQDLPVTSGTGASTRVPGGTPTRSSSATSPAVDASGGET
jgi:hypothetical protein